MSSDDSSHWRGTDTECDDRSQTNNNTEAGDDSQSARDHRRVRRLSYSERAQLDVRTGDCDQPSDDSHKAGDGGRPYGPTEQGDSSTTYDDTGPMPWLTVDYEASASHFGSDERPADLDENNTPIDDGLMGQTSIREDEGDGSTNWEWLRKLNDGWGESGRSTQIWKAGVKRDLDIICDRLGATDHQKERATWLLKGIEIKDELLKRGSVETVLLGVVSMVIDEDRTRYARHGNDEVQSVTRDTEFKELRDKFNINNRTIHTVRKRLRETDVYESPNT